MLTEKDLLDQREALQDDLMTQLDGLEDGFITQICETVVERFQILLDKLKEQS